MNGDFLRRTGHGIGTLSPSELCDVAYATLVDGLERQYYAQLAAGARWDDDDPLGETIVRLEERLGLREDPEALALELHKRMLAAQGKPWDDTPVGAGSGQWWEQDVDDFRDMSDLDRPRPAQFRRPSRTVKETL